MAGLVERNLLQKLSILNVDLEVYECLKYDACDVVNLRFVICYPFIIFI